MATHVVTTFLETAGDRIPSDPTEGKLTLTGGLQTRIEETIAGGATNTQVNLAIDNSELISLFIYCDRDLTIKTNSSGAPDNTINLRAGEPLHWHENAYFANPVVAADVTKIYVTLAAGDDATLIVETIQDATP